MASRSFLLLALAFAVVLLITSEVAAAKELASENDSDINDNGRGGYNKGGGHGGHSKYDIGHRGHGGHNKGGGGRGGHDNEGGRGGHDNEGGRGGHPIVGGHKGCKLGRCCRGERYSSKECKCCSTVEEANAYKQTQN